METDKSLYRYPGTKPFEANEYKLFKGRDEDIQRLQELISLQDLIVLYSRSGLGKSSLLNAGLVNKFKEEEGLVPLFVRFGAYYKGTTLAPRERLINIINEEYHQDTDTFLFQKLIPRDQVTMHLLWYLVKSLQISDPAKNTFIIIFDQFEELFTYPDREIEIFKKELSELLFITVPQQLRNVIKNKQIFDKEYLTKEQTLILYEPLNIKVLFAIRSDKLSLLNKLTDYFPSVLKYCYELNPLNREQAKQAIVIPATLTDQDYMSPPFSFSGPSLKLVLDSLTNSNKRDVGGLFDNYQEIETFQLQIVCKYAENLVIEKGVTEISPADFGNIKEIFENHYRNIINKLSQGDQLPARQLIEEKLIIDGTRVSMPIPFILKDKGMTKELLDELISTHIIRPEQNNTVEISHDTLIEPILKYYAERKKEEEVENELREKEEEIRRFKEEQQIQIEKQRQKANRNRLFVTTVSIALAISILLAAYASSQKKIAEANFIRALQQTKKAENIQSIADSVKKEAKKMLKIANEARDTAEALKLLAFQLRDTIDIQRALTDYQKKITEATRETIRLAQAAENMKEDNPTIALRLAEIGVRLNNEYGLGTGILYTANQILETGAFYKTILESDPGTFISSSHDGKKIMTCTGKGRIDIWGVKDEEKINTPLNWFKLDTSFGTASFSESDAKVIASDIEGNIVIFDFDKNNEKRLKGKRPDVISVSISGKDKIMINVANERSQRRLQSLGKIKILDINGDSIAALHEDVTHAVFSPGNGDTILTGNVEGIPKLWDLQGKLLKTFSSNSISSSITCLAYSSDHTKIIAGYSDGTAISWEIGNGDIYAKLPNDKNHMTSLSLVAFKADFNDDIFTGTTNGVVEWLGLSNSTYYTKYRLQGHSGAINSLGISIRDINNFDFFTGSSVDHTVRVWHNLGDLKVRVTEPRDGNLKKFLYSNKFLDILTTKQKKEFYLK
ncbi:MAG: hypothetical protein ABIN89_22950 [Chitinophagaceae bacterium]